MGRVVSALLTPALWKQRQTDLCKIEANMAYIVSSRLARVTQRDPVSICPQQL